MPTTRDPYGRFGPGTTLGSYSGAFNPFAYFQQDEGGKWALNPIFEKGISEGWTGEDWQNRGLGFFDPDAYASAKSHAGGLGELLRTGAYRGQLGDESNAPAELSTDTLFGKGGIRNPFARLRDSPFQVGSADAHGYSLHNSRGVVYDPDWGWITPSRNINQPREGIMSYVPAIGLSALMGGLVAPELAAATGFSQGAASGALNAGMTLGEGGRPGAGSMLSLLGGLAGVQLPGGTSQFMQLLRLASMGNQMRQRRKGYALGGPIDEAPAMPLSGPIEGPRIGGLGTFPMPVLPGGESGALMGGSDTAIPVGKMPTSMPAIPVGKHPMMPKAPFSPRSGGDFGSLLEQMLHMQRDGFVRGFGGPRSDNIPTMTPSGQHILTSPGEYVLNADQVMRAGGPNAIERALGRAGGGRTYEYAEGGVVEVPAPGSKPTDQRSFMDWLFHGSKIDARQQAAYREYVEQMALVGQRPIPIQEWLKLQQQSKPMPKMADGGTVPGSSSPGGFDIGSFLNFLGGGFDLAQAINPNIFGGMTPQQAANRADPFASQRGLYQPQLLQLLSQQPELMTQLQAEIGRGVANRPAGIGMLQDLITQRAGKRPGILDQTTDEMSMLLKDPSSIAKTPAYRFLLDQGTSAIDRSAAASGGLFSGNRGYELAKFGEGLASQSLDSEMNRLLGVFNAQSRDYNVGLGTLGNLLTEESGVYNTGLRTLGDLFSGQSGARIDMGRLLGTLSGAGVDPSSGVAAQQRANQARQGNLGYGLEGLGSGLSRLFRGGTTPSLGDFTGGLGGYIGAGTDLGWNSGYDLGDGSGSWTSGFDLGDGQGFDWGSFDNTDWTSELASLYG